MSSKISNKRFKEGIILKANRTMTRMTLLCDTVAHLLLLLLAFPSPLLGRGCNPFYIRVIWDILPLAGKGGGRGCININQDKLTVVGCLRNTTSVTVAGTTGNGGHSYVITCLRRCENVSAAIKWTPTYTWYLHGGERMSFQWQPGVYPDILYLDFTCIGGRQET